jgi:hypothetical protein
MENENPCLKVHLGKLKKPWVEYCHSIGKKPGAALKEAIEHQLAMNASKSEKPTKVFRQAGEPTSDEGKERFEVLLTASEKSALHERAALENCSARRWVIDAIRAGLTKEPQFAMKEIETLGESNYQLLAIGRNLNQIAKAINEGRRNSVALDSIRELRKRIDAHTEIVSNAMRASLERWSIE